MKRIVLAFTVVIICTALFTACQATPENPIVIGKGDGQLEQKIAEQTNTMPSDLPQSGEEINETITNDKGNVQLIINAKVVRYDAFSFPSVVVTPQRFTQQQADTIIKALAGDAVFYAPGQISIEQLNEQIVLLKKRMNEAPGDRKAGYESVIKDLEAQTGSAVPEADLIPASATFAGEHGNTAYSESIVGQYSKNGSKYTLIIQNSEDGKLSNISLQAAGENYSIQERAGGDGQKTQVPFKYDDALRQAQDLIQRFAPELDLADAFVVASQDGSDAIYAYQFVFTRKVSGFQLVYDASVQSADGTEEDIAAPYQAPWPYESLSVVINENSVQALDWQGPCRVEETLNENVSLLSFEEIMGVFRKLVFIKNDAWETYSGSITLDGKPAGDGKAVVTVNRITLGLSRVQSGMQYYLIPVWDFYGTVDYLLADGTSIYESKGRDEGAIFRGSLRSILTINAIDGSIIDRGLGY